MGTSMLTFPIASKKKKDRKPFLMSLKKQMKQQHTRNQKNHSQP